MVSKTMKIIQTWNFRKFLFQFFLSCFKHLKISWQKYFWKKIYRIIPSQKLKGKKFFWEIFARKITKWEFSYFFPKNSTLTIHFFLLFRTHSFRMKKEVAQNFRNIKVKQIIFNKIFRGFPNSFRQRILIFKATLNSVSQFFLKRLLWLKKRIFQFFDISLRF